MARRRARQPDWVHLGDDELLDLRLCDLGVELAGSPIERRIELLGAELEHRGIRFRPHFWVADEWFSPDDVPGVAVPFFVLHPRLTKLEYRQMFDVEGGTDRWCMQILRHEAGHAIDTAYGLHRKREWSRLFGRRSQRYPRHYTPEPKSRDYVLHLDWWYAQSHPTEDFAETFAVWLKPRSRWRRHYRGWPALRKLEYVDEVMRSIAGCQPLVRTRRHVEPLSRNRTTLRQYYEKKRAHYGIQVPELYDRDLLRLFAKPPATNGSRRSAAGFLRRARAELCQLCARGTGEHSYAIAQLVQEMIVRCREMKLIVDRPEEQIKLEVAIFISVQAVNFLHTTHHRIPL